MSGAEQGKSNDQISQLHTLLRADFTCEQWQKFDQQNLDKYRIKILLEMKKTEIETWINKKANLPSPCKEKSKALALKDCGNKNFGNGNFILALQNYSHSLKWMPGQSSDSAIVYANRSACLFHLKEYALALQDAEIAFKLDYPKDLHYKLYERVGRCCLHMGNTEQATKMISMAIKNVEESQKLDECKRWKMKCDLEAFLKTITSKSSNVNGTNESDIDKLIVPDLVGGCGKYLRHATNHCQLMHNDIEGRFISATQDIHPGDTVFVDKAYVSALSPEFYHKHCLQCFQQIRVPIACPNCSVVSFCSPKCQDTAWDTHHRFECQMLPFLMKSKISITCYLALRILTQANPSEALSWYDLANYTEESCNNNNEMQKDYNNSIPVPKSPLPKSNDEEKIYKSDYRALFDHVTHSKDRNTQENFQQAVFALYLLFVLKRTNYFKELLQKVLSEAEEDKGMEVGEERKAEEMIEMKLGTLIFRFLNFLQFNTHEISTWDCENKESLYIGAGLFNTLTLSNHACVPTLTRYFVKDTVVVRAIRTIRKGEQVTDNYGPMYATTSTEDRQLTLLNAFWFECQCAACKCDWPVFDKLSEEYTLQCANCQKSLFPGDNDQTLRFAFRCPNCSQTTNTLAVIKCLQELESKYKEASEFMTAGQVQKALEISLDSISRLDNLVILPCKLHQIFQQTAKTCFQKLGNKSLPESLLWSNGSED